MNRKMVFYIVGMVLMVEAALLLLPIIVALIYHEHHAPKVFIITLFAHILTGFLLTRIRVAKRTIYSREGLVAVAICWVLISVGGALPFWLSREIPRMVDAVFETVSGFTTTGASILTNVEGLSKSMLFWRSLTHWVGGMGVLVFVMAAAPLAGGGSNIHLMRAESPGYDVTKVVPTSRGTALTLYGIYLAITLAEVLFLLLAGNPLYDSLTLSFGTAGTGGFAVRNTSLAEYSSATQNIITVFMTLFGINFSCYYLLLIKKWKSFIRNEELLSYLGILLAAIAVITFSIRGMYATVWDSLKHAAFQVSSVMTTTGYCTTDFDKWPELSRMIMIVVMCIGACVGSTGGGLKVARAIILAKNAHRQLRRTVRPDRVSSVRFNGKPLSESMVSGINSYFALYMILFVLSVLLVSIEGKDTVSNVSAVVATFNNIGPGLNIVGAVGNYSSYKIGRAHV